MKNARQDLVSLNFTTPAASELVLKTSEEWVMTKCATPRAWQPLLKETDSRCEALTLCFIRYNFCHQAGQPLILVVISAPLLRYGSGSPDTRRS
jgi:hypothetical protein